MLPARPLAGYLRLAYGHLRHVYAITILPLTLPLLRCRHICLFSRQEASIYAAAAYMPEPRYLLIFTATLIDILFTFSH